MARREGSRTAEFDISTELAHRDERRLTEQFLKKDLLIVAANQIDRHMLKETAVRWQMNWHEASTPQEAGSLLRGGLLPQMAVVLLPADIGTNSRTYKKYQVLLNRLNCPTVVYHSAWQRDDTICEHFD